MNSEGRFALLLAIALTALASQPAVRAGQAGRIKAAADRRRARKGDGRLQDRRRRNAQPRARSTRRSRCPIGSASTRSANRASPSDASGETIQLSRLCAGTAAGLCRSAMPARSFGAAGGSAGRQARASGGRGFPAQREGAFRLRAGSAGKTSSTYKRAYVAMASAAGLTKEQVVRIYSFESGGTGKYDVQAGLENPNRPGAKATSTALGYNQLLTANTTSLLAEKGETIRQDVARRARRSFPARRRRSWSARSRC